MNDIDNSVLLLNGLSVEILNALSYKSELGLSLKKNIHYFQKESVISEMEKMTEWLFQQEILDEIALDYRIKSIQSIGAKYDRYYPDRQMRQVFNDILGFRAFCNDYNDVLALGSEEFRIVDMSKGKRHDDGYRGVHLYYQKDNFHYPIEIQFNTFYDRQLNNWLHDYLYKKGYPDEIGRKLRAEYEAGKIRSDEEFKEVLKCAIS